MAGPRPIPPRLTVPQVRTVYGIMQRLGPTTSTTLQGILLRNPKLAEGLVANEQSIAAVGSVTVWAHPTDYILMREADGSHNLIGVAHDDQKFPELGRYEQGNFQAPSIKILGEVENPAAVFSKLREMQLLSLRMNDLLIKANSNEKFIVPAYTPRNEEDTLLYLRDKINWLNEQIENLQTHRPLTPMVDHKPAKLSIPQPAVNQNELWDHVAHMTRRYAAIEPSIVTVMVGKRSFLQGPTGARFAINPVQDGPGITLQLPKNKRHPRDAVEYEQFTILMTRSPFVSEAALIANWLGIYRASELLRSDQIRAMFGVQSQTPEAILKQLDLLPEQFLRRQGYLDPGPEVREKQLESAAANISRSQRVSTGYYHFQMINGSNFYFHPDSGDLYIIPNRAEALGVPPGGIKLSMAGPITQADAALKRLSASSTGLIC